MQLNTQRRSGEIEKTTCLVRSGAHTSQTHTTSNKMNQTKQNIFSQFGHERSYNKNRPTLSFELTPTNPAQLLSQL